jgi:hypothetical protein
MSLPNELLVDTCHVLRDARFIELNKQMAALKRITCNLQKDDQQNVWLQMHFLDLTQNVCKVANGSHKFDADDKVELEEFIQQVELGQACTFETYSNVNFEYEQDSYITINVYCDCSVWEVPVTPLLTALKELLVN